MIFKLSYIAYSALGAKRSYSTINLIQLFIEELNIAELALKM